MLPLNLRSRLALSLPIVAGAIAMLWYEKFFAHHPGVSVLLLIVPIAFVAAILGSLAAIAATVCATLAAPFFLYEPLYSWRIANVLGLSDLFWFDLLSLLTIKCVIEFAKKDVRSR